MNAVTYVLILFAHVGPMGDGNSNSLFLQEFNSDKACAAAGVAAKRLAQGTAKSIEWVCVPK
jgi:hypothetical protein